jgi:hypothetical protein
MLVKYVIHRIGTPKMAWVNHPSYWQSEYWNNQDGWGHKSTSDIFEDKTFNLPLDGEWVEIYTEERIG